MHLPARLSASTLGDLLGTLHREGTTGLLELREILGPRGRTVPGRIHRLHLRNGLIASVETALPVPPLGEILRRDGIITDRALQVLVSRIRAGDFRTSAQILESDGLASEAAVRAGLRRQLRERLDCVFALEDAGVSFHTARPVPNAVRIAPLSVFEFLHGRPRARDRGRKPASKPGGGEAGVPHSALRPVVNDTRESARQLLRLPQGAGVDEIRRAFRKLASRMHPDRLGAAERHELERRQAQFAELSAAYHLLVA